jgi:hypothetical protein
MARRIIFWVEEEPTEIGESKARSFAGPFSRMRTRWKE